MRPMLSAVVVAIVLLTAAFLIVIPAQDRTLSSPAAASTGLRTAVAPTYHILRDFATAPVLPGYHDTLIYEVLNDTNGAPQAGLSTITILGTYYNTGDAKLLTLPGTPINVSTAPIGSWNFVVPANASANPAFPPVVTIWANSTTLHMNQSVADDLEIGSLEIYSSSVCDLVGLCGTLTTGNPATVSVNAEALYGVNTLTPASNETVKFLFYSTGSSPVTVPGVPASVKTDGQGDAAVTFTPSNTVFNVPGPDHVEIEVTDSVNASLMKDVNLTFNLYNPVGTTNFAFWLNQDEYYSGEAVTANWQWAGTNATVGTLNVTNYFAYSEVPFNIFANGLIDSTLASGSFTFNLPATFSGDFTVQANVHNGSDLWYLTASAYASEAILYAVPSERYFNPGDTVTVAVTPEGPALTGATISAFVQASNSGQTLFNSTVTGTSFQFTVPKVAPAEYYDIAVWASTPAAGTIASDSTDVEEAYGYSLWVGVSTVSAYSDGSFTPGQTIQLSYKITAYGTSTLPTLVEIEVCSVDCGAGTPAVMTWIESAASGSVPFTIPASAPDGPQTFELYAGFASGSGESIFTVIVNSTPSALNYELVGGSGLTVGWLILLILIIVVALIILATRRRGKPSQMVMTPASGGSSAPEWKEPQASGTPPPSSGSSDTPASPPSSSQ